MNPRLRLLALLIPGFAILTQSCEKPTERDLLQKAVNDIYANMSDAGKKGINQWDSIYQVARDSNHTLGAARGELQQKIGDGPYPKLDSLEELKDSVEYIAGFSQNYERASNVVDSIKSGNTNYEKLATDLEKIDFSGEDEKRARYWNADRSQNRFEAELRDGTPSAGFWEETLKAQFTFSDYVEGLYDMINELRDPKTDDTRKAQLESDLKAYVQQDIPAIPVQASRDQLIEGWKALNAQVKAIQAADKDALYKLNRTKDGQEYIMKVAGLNALVLKTITLLDAGYDTTEIKKLGGFLQGYANDAKRRQQRYVGNTDYKKFGPALKDAVEQLNQVSRRVGGFDIPEGAKVFDQPVRY